MSSPFCPNCHNDLRDKCSIIYHLAAQQMAHLGLRVIVMDDEGMCFPSSRHQPFCAKCGTDIASVLQACISDLVHVKFACPICKTRDPDVLLLGEDDLEGYVHCTACDHYYHIG